MKELVKPNNFESEHKILQPYCEVDCSSCDHVANRGCRGGATNNSLDNEDDILF
jgi:hypothetical protein